MCGISGAGSAGEKRGMKLVGVLWGRMQDGRLLEAAQHFFAASILAHSNLASWDTDAAVEACH